MKTRTWVVATLVFFIVATGNATDFPKMNLIPVATEKVIFAYQSTEATPLEITLSDHQGEILYFQKTKKRHSEFKKVFDFSELGEGLYCLCVNFGNRSISRNLEIGKTDITVGQPQRLFEPYFYLQDKKLSVSFFNCPQKRVYINIYNHGKLIQSINLGKDIAIQKRLDLSKLINGDYEIVLSEKFTDHRYIAKL